MNRWENSEYYTRTFSPLLQMGVPRVKRWDFTADQMRALNTTPQTLFPAISGYTYWFTLGAVYRTGTDVFTTVGLTQFGVVYVATTNIQAINFLSGVLSSANVGSVATAGSALQQQTGSGPGQIGGKAAKLFTNVDLGGTGSPCSLVLAYLLIPTVIDQVGGPVTPLL